MTMITPSYVIRLTSGARAIEAGWRQASLQDNSQIDEPPSYEEALKQGLPTTRPIAPMATGVLGQHTPVTLDLPPPADTQQKPVLPGPSAVVVTRPSRASLRRAASGPRSTL